MILKSLPHWFFCSLRISLSGGAFCPMFLGIKFSCLQGALLATFLILLSFSKCPVGALTPDPKSKASAERVGISHIETSDSSPGIQILYPFSFCMAYRQPKLRDGPHYSITKSSSPEVWRYTPTAQHLGAEARGV